MRKNYLSWYPKEAKQIVLENIKEQIAIEASSAALTRYSPERGNVHWRILCEMDSEGKSVITGPRFLTNKLIKRLMEKGVSFEYCTIGED